MSQSTEKLVAINTEAMLLSWSESSTRGRTVTFLLPPEDEFHPFRSYAVKSGKQAGHRFQMVLVELNDQDKPVVQAQKMSQLAAVLCRDQDFWKWAGGRTFIDITSEAEARQWILDGAQIKSRAELDTNRMAHDWFKFTVAEPYREYQSNLAGRIL